MHAKTIPVLTPTGLRTEGKQGFQRVGERFSSDPGMTFAMSGIFSRRAALHIKTGTMNSQKGGSKCWAREPLVRTWYMLAFTCFPV